MRASVGSLLLFLAGVLTDAFQYYQIPPRAHPAFPQLLSALPSSSNINASILLVPLDHADPGTRRSSEHIRLRYWVDASCLRPGGPLFVHQGGEGTQGAVPCGAREAQFGAIAVSVEHRFYGESWVEGKSLEETLSVDYLKHLTVQNALADTKAVIDHVAGLYSSSSGKVVSFGGSYSGALSAFLRMEYPDSIVASVSESGVVSAVSEFPGFDTAIDAAAQVSDKHPGGGDPCAAQLRGATAAMERMVSAGSADQLLRIFNASGMALEDFWYAVADGPAMLIQYGSKSALCTAMAQLPPGSSDLTTAEHLAHILFLHYGPGFVRGCFYDTRCFSSSRASANASALPMERQWRWQKCNEMGFLQSAPTDHQSIRSSSLTFDSLQRQCDRAFGRHSFEPLNHWIRDKYGSFRPSGSYIFFLDYSDDPWRAATIDREWVDSSPSAAARNLKSCYTSCNSCGHCGAGVPAHLKQCEANATTWLTNVLSRYNTVD